jgi:microcin C transport system substrate-binding protein
MNLRAWALGALVAVVLCPSAALAEPGIPGIPPELGGPGFTGEGWETAVATDPGHPDAVKGGRLRMHLPEFPSNLRRYGKDSNHQFNSAAAALIYETLLTLDGNTLETAPALATHWKISDDKMTFSFRLNPEARWADGMPFTADDVIATWNLLVDETILFPYTNILYGNYEEPVADSPYILHVTTKEENWRHFLYFAISMRILPAHVIGGMSGSEYLEEFQFKMVPGTGPYEILEENIDKGVSITLTRRDDYWAADFSENKNIYNFDEIEWMVVMDERLALEKLKKGELDVYLTTRASWWVNEFNFEEVERGLVLKRKIFNEEPQGVSGLAMNTRHAPFDDIRVRRAMAHLYDRDKLIEKLFHGEYLKLKSYHPAGRYENPNNQYYEYDPEKAVALLAEAGWKERNADGWLVNDRGEVFELTLSFDTPSWERIHTVLQEDLARVGIKMNLKQMTRATQFKQTMEHNFDITFQAWTGLYWPNPNSSWHSKNADPENTTNITGMKDARVDSIAKLYDEEYDEMRRVELIQALDAILMDECHYALAWYGPFTRLVFWNKFGYPDGMLGRTGDYLSVQSLWFIDPEKQQALEQARQDPAATMPKGEVEDKFWLKKLGKI